MAKKQITTFAAAVQAALAESDAPAAVAPDESEKD